MMPRVDLPEMVLEVMSWLPGFAESFTHVAGTGARVADLGVSVAAVLCSQAMNVGLTPVTTPGSDALTRDRLRHVDQHYIRSDTLSAADTVLVNAQADVSLTQLWGGGCVASVDGMRFVVPVRSIHARLWRIDPAADYGPLDKAARGRIDVEKICSYWEDMCRVAVSMNRGEVSAHEVTRMISRDGNPTALGQAIAHYGRISKTLHILRLADDEPYRREAKAQANLQEGRHDLGRTVFHGRKGELHRAYLDGMEDQLSALGLVLNITVLWNSVYLSRALDELRAQGYPVRDEDAARLSPFIRKHVRMEGHYSFHLPDLGGSHRPLRDPDAPDDDD
jgi:TnpA family transposase